jgi:hypothetical protein
MFFPSTACNTCLVTHKNKPDIFYHNAIPQSKTQPPKNKKSRGFYAAAV